MSTTYARKSGDRTRRDVCFLKNLQRVASVHLPETAAAIIERPNRGPRWKTFRLRPELADVIEALQHRFTRSRSFALTASEVIAAALTDALPRITAREEFR